MAVTVALATTVTGLAAVTATRWVDAVVPPLLPAVQALVPLVAVPAALVALVATVVRRRRTAVAAALLVAVHIALALPWWTAGPRAAAQPSTRAFTVLAANMQYGFGDAAALARAARRLDVDLLIAVEATASTRAQLDDSGIQRQLPYRIGKARSGPGGALLLSRYPLRSTGLDTPDIRYELPTALVSAPDGDVLVAGVHPVAPVPADAAVWDRELSVLAAWADTAPPDVPMVLAGDFNATNDHPALRRFGDAGLADAHRQLGRGRPRTWPVDYYAPIGPLFDLDHVLVRGFAVEAGGLVTVPDTDHAAVWVALQPRT